MFCMSDEKVVEFKPQRREGDENPMPPMVNVTVAPAPEKPRKKSLRDRYWKTWTTLRLMVCAAVFYAGAIWLPELDLMPPERAMILSWVLVAVAVFLYLGIAFGGWIGPFIGVVSSGAALFAMKKMGLNAGDVWFDRGSNLLTLAILCLVLSVFAPSLRGD